MSRKSEVQPETLLVLGGVALVGLGLAMWGGAEVVQRVVHDAALTPSGVAWVDRFPGSRSTASLVQPFRGSVERFIAAIEAAGGHVRINVARRPYERTWLQHWAYLIAVKGLNPAAVPALAGVPIDWVAGGVAGARAMNDAYDTVYPGASLTSNHVAGRAIDMNIDFPWATTVRDASGRPVTIAAGDGDTNPVLFAVGATYGVHKLPIDHPHWSFDGA